MLFENHFLFFTAAGDLYEIIVKTYSATLAEPVRGAVFLSLF